VNKQVLNEKYKVFIDTSLKVRLCSKWNYVINMYSQATNSPILKNLCQVKQEKHMNKKLNISLVHHLWLDLDQGRIVQMLHLSIGYLWKQLDHNEKFFKNKSIEDMKYCVRQDDSWRRINKYLAMIDHASEKSKRESWRRGIVCDGEGQMDVQFEESSYPWRATYH
jgi:hypothetical protein